MMVPVCGGDAQCDSMPQQEFKAHLRINANLCSSAQTEPVLGHEKLQELRKASAETKY